MKKTTLATGFVLLAMSNMAFAEGAPQMQMGEETIVKEMEASSATSAAYLPFILFVLLVAMGLNGGGGGSPMMYSLGGADGDDVLLDPADEVTRT